MNESGHNPCDLTVPDISPLTGVSRAENLTELELMLSAPRPDQQGGGQEATSTNRQLVEAIRRQVDEHYASYITLSGMAGQYRISPSYLSLLFTEQVGKNFIDYLTERRIKKAQELLKHTEMRIYEIAECRRLRFVLFQQLLQEGGWADPSEYREAWTSGHGQAAFAFIGRLYQPRLRATSAGPVPQFRPDPATDRYPRPARAAPTEALDDDGLPEDPPGFRRRRRSVRPDTPQATAA